MGGRWGAYPAVINVIGSVDGAGQPAAVAGISAAALRPVRNTDGRATAYRS